jgi:hypothetical protein
LPADFLLPLFTLTLLANAILVVFAIRGLRRGQFDPDRPSGFDRPSGLAGPSRPIEPTDAPPITEELARAIASRRALLDPEGAADAPTATTPADPPAPPPAASPVAATSPMAAIDPAPAAATPTRRSVNAAGPATKGSRPARPSAPPAARSATSGPDRPAEPGRRARRRFSLPPLDDDHERVSRSLETFLGGVENAGEDSPTSDAASVDGATTVAVVAVDGLPARPRRSRSARTTDDDATASALAMVERTIRGAARGSDIVTVADRGRFRIVLPATGELAARAYLRRIRATVEPLLESADRPLRLAVATATVLDEPIADAVRRADIRLTAALAAMTAPGKAPAVPPPDGSDATQAESDLDDAGTASPRAAAD